MTLKEGTKLGLTRNFILTIKSCTDEENHTEKYEDISLWKLQLRHTFEVEIEQLAHKTLQAWV